MNNFYELAESKEEIARFTQAENTKTLQRFSGPQLDADTQTARLVLEDPQNQPFLSRRGQWYFTYHVLSDAPKGQWLRCPAATKQIMQAEWELVFDLDAYCKEDGRNWEWRGATTAWFDPERVLIELSLDGSDQCIYREFDCRTKNFVTDGFELPLGRNGVCWETRDTLLWASAEAGDATDSGWAGKVYRVHRDRSLQSSEAIFEAKKSDLVVAPYVAPTEGGPKVFVSRYLEIGKEQIFCISADGTQSQLPTPETTQACNNATHAAYVTDDTNPCPGTLCLVELSTESTRDLFVPKARRVIDPNSLIFLRDWLIWTVVDMLQPEVWAVSLTEIEAVPFQMDLPDQDSTIWINLLDAEPEPGQETLVLGLEGCISPSRTYSGQLDARGRVDWKPFWSLQEIFSSSGLVQHLYVAISDDGTEVPYHYFGPSSPSNETPVLLYGYGGYASSAIPWYNPILGKLWLEQGGGYAVAHIRGGGEFGPNWHKSAVREHRPRSFEDFAAIARDLVQRGLTQPSRLACHGVSNGGLLVGVMLTKYPDLFGAIWSAVGTFDMLGFHHFPAGRAWIDEYGDPDDPKAAEWLRSYSPLHNIPNAQETTLPPCLIDTHSHDDRVDPSHSRRFAAALRAAGHDTYFFEHTEGGHGGGGGSEGKAAAEALGFRFLWEVVGKK